MALIRCPECGSHVSDQAVACPGCGYPMAARRAQGMDSAAGLPASKTNGVREALRSGNKIEAIKIYREATGLGLKESKDAVEILEVEMGLRSPAPPPGVRSSAGSFLVMLLLILLLLAGIVLWILRH